MKQHSIPRRKFLAASAAALGLAPLAFLRAQEGSANDEITIGIVGCGYQGPINLGNFLGIQGVRVVAVCDVDSIFMAAAKAKVDEHYKNSDCKTYAHYADLYAHPGLDAVCLSVPDHWHARISIDASNAGLHIFGEKPFTWGLAEGRRVIDAINKNKTVWQTGSWQRSTAEFRRFRALIQNDTLGKLTRVECGTPSGLAVRNFGLKDEKGNAQPNRDPKLPGSLDWKTWCGPLKEVPYTPELHPFNWRWKDHFGGGQLMDWVGHHVDIALWTLALDGTGPTKVEGQGELGKHEFYNTYINYAYNGTFADGRVIEVRSDFMGTKITGEKGWIAVNRGKLEASDREMLRNVPSDFDTKPPNHWQNFIDCIRSGGLPASHAEGAHRAASFGQLAIVAMDTKQAVNWDPKTERVIDNPEQANHPRLGSRI